MCADARVLKVGVSRVSTITKETRYSTSNFVVSCELDGQRYNGNGCDLLGAFTSLVDALPEEYRGYVLTQEEKDEAAAQTRRWTEEWNTKQAAERQRRNRGEAALRYVESHGLDITLDTTQEASNA